MRILLDTNVISELSRSSANPRVANHLAMAAPDSLFLSAVTIGEIVFGLTRLTAGPKKRGLASWLKGIEASFDERILLVDVEISRIWGELSATRAAAGHEIRAEDGLIAATALRHGLHLMTRNIKDFQHCGVMLINPWEE